MFAPQIPSTMHATIKRVILAAVLLLLPLAATAQGPVRVVGGGAVVNPPRKIAARKPEAQDFNVIFRTFLGTEAVDVSHETIDPKLTELVAQETSNSLFRRLKLREQTYEGAILVTPVSIDRQQIIVVAARIVYKQGLSKTLQAEYLQFIFSETGKFVEVRKGIATVQDL